MFIFFYLYNVVWYLSLPFVFLYLFWRGMKAPAYRQRCLERLALSLPKTKVDVWIHAVSLGEVLAAAAIIDSCLARGYTLVVTCMTPTGSAQIQKRWGQRIKHCYAPYDTYFTVKRFLNAFQPKLCVIFETELWPMSLAICHQRSIPVILANARISDRSYGRYLKTKFFWRHMCSYFHTILVQSQKDKDRFLSLGAKETQIDIAGNIKFNQAKVDQLNKWQIFKQKLGQRSILVLGSSHAGEEELFLSAWTSELRKRSILCIAPRHPERFDTVWTACSNFAVQRVSCFDATKACDLLLLDTVGDLSSFYAIADAAFVGGSLLPIGGHNVLEPLVYGVPVMTGPYTFNQHDLLRILLEHQAIIQLASAASLEDDLKKILYDEDLRQSLIKNGLIALETYQGSLDKHMQAVIKNLDSVSL